MPIKPPRLTGPAALVTLPAQIRLSLRLQSVLPQGENVVCVYTVSGASFYFVEAGEEVKAGFRDARAEFTAASTEHRFNLISKKQGAASVRIDVVVTDSLGRDKGAACFVSIV